MRKNAFISSTLVLTLLVLAAGVFIWYYFKNSSSPVSNIVYDLLNQSSMPDTKGWNNFSNTQFGLQLQYPPKWFNYDNNYLSEYPYTPGNTRNDEIYNAIVFYKITNQAHMGYNNDTFFNKLYSLKVNDSFTNEFYSSDKAVYTLLAKGKLRSGQHFVVYKAQTENSDYIADILVQSDFIRLNLVAPNDEGVSSFIDIVKTVTLN